MPRVPPASEAILTDDLAPAFRPAPGTACDVAPSPSHRGAFLQHALRSGLWSGHFIMQTPRPSNLPLTFLQRVTAVVSLAFCVLVLGFGCHRGPDILQASLPPSGKETAMAGTPTARSLPTQAMTECGLPSRLFHSEWPRVLPSTSPQERDPMPTGSFTLALLPDTQYYTGCRYPHLRNQAAFIERERVNRNILAAISLGDITDQNTPDEWEFARDALAPLGRYLPLLLTTGNHDVGQAGTSDNRDSLLNQYFSEDWARATGALRETLQPGHLENAFYSIALGKVKLGILMLEWSPRQVSVDWANQVLTRYADHRVIVATHAYLYDDSTRYDHEHRPDQAWNPYDYATAQGALAADGNHDGEMLWNALIRRHAGIFLVVSGHVLGQGTGHLTSRGDSGNSVHQILVNYQMLEQGGLGYLRLVEIAPDGRSLHMKTYSPSLGLYSYAAEQDYRLMLEPPL
ncbi:MAG TPA: metallophosphoesterase [Polyangiaceae bacterium]